MIIEWFGQERDKHTQVSNGSENDVNCLFNPQAANNQNRSDLDARSDGNAHCQLESPFAVIHSGSGNNDEGDPLFVDQ